jgi:hypothetical protein
MLTLENISSVETCLSELMIIFKNNYCKDEKFKRELSIILIQATGNDTLGSLCREIIGDF